jgi:hypothetical protein
MKKIISLIVIVLISISTINAQKKVIKPIGKSPVKIIIGKKRTYYNLNKSLDFSIKGLNKIAVFSRARIDNKLIDYKLSYSFDDGKKEPYNILKSKIDKRSVYTKKSLKKRVAKAFKKEIEIPVNAKVLHLFLEGNKTVDVAVKSIAKKRKSLKPINKAKKIRIIRGKSKKYYKLNSKKPTLVKVTGKGKLIVYTRKRLNKKDNKNYNFTYQVGSSKVKKVSVDDVKKAKNAAYKSLKTTKKPSTNHKMIIELKDGENQVVFSSQDHVDARFVFVKK